MSHKKDPAVRKASNRAAQVRYRATHRAEILAKRRLYEATHRDEILVRKRARRAANKERLNAESRAYHRANAAAIAARQKRWRAGTKAMRAATAARWWKANQAHALAKHRVWVKTHPEAEHARQKRWRASKRHAPLSDFTAAQWRELQAAFDHCCAYCGTRAKGHLTQDHIQPLSKGGSHTLRNIVPACRTCNCRKQAGPVLVAVQPLLCSVAPAHNRSHAS